MTRLDDSSAPEPIHGSEPHCGWIHASTGEADENLSPEFRATGLDANGGYAEFMTVPEAYASPIPDGWARPFVGTVLLAVATTLPESSTTFAAIRLGNYDMAIGNIFGSISFNMLILVADLRPECDVQRDRITPRSAPPALGYGIRDSSG